MTRHLVYGVAIAAGLVMIAALIRPGIMPWSERRADIVRAESDGRAASIRANSDASTAAAVADIARAAGRVPLLVVIVMGSLVVILAGGLVAVCVILAQRGAAYVPAMGPDPGRAIVHAEPAQRRSISYPTEHEAAAMGGAYYIQEA